jgi:hypothetical protein
VTAPNFFLVGAAKSGTTTLYAALRAHDDVYLPTLKEPHVYAYLADPSTASHLYPDEATARRRYRELYDDVRDEAAIGDASTTNLVVAGAAAAIAGDVPEARIVAILRHPVDRAFSHFCHFVSAGGDDLRDFAEAVAAEAARQDKGYPFTYQYLGWSRYSEQLRPYFELFGRDRVLVHLYDDLCSDGETVVRATFRFLGVDDHGPLPPVGRLNQIRPEPAARGRTRLRRLLGRDPSPARRRPTLDPDLRAALTASFEDEIARLEDLLRRDLAGWRA